MTGHKIHVGKSVKIKLGKGVTITRDGKVKVMPVYRDASAAIRAKKSKRQRPVRRTV